MHGTNVINTIFLYHVFSNYPISIHFSKLCKYNKFHKSSQPNSLGSVNSPSDPFSLSLVGSKFRVPTMDRAVTSSGDVTNAWVAGFASLRPVKFRLYDVTMVFFSPFFTSLRSHWPMHGPHALARTVPPKSLKICAYEYKRNRLHISCCSN